MISDLVLLSQYKTMHEAGHFAGGSLPKHARAIGDLVREYDAKNLLDYGCGKGEQYFKQRAHDAWGLMPRLYDPAVEEFSSRPFGLYDGVICTDVAEHVPEEDVPSFLLDVMSYARRFVFMSICTRPAKKTLPDGRNVHLTVKPKEWWMEWVTSVKKGLRPVHVEIAWHED